MLKVNKQPSNHNQLTNHQDTAALEKGLCLKVKSLEKFVNHVVVRFEPTTFCFCPILINIIKVIVGLITSRDLIIENKR